MKLKLLMPFILPLVMASIHVQAQKRPDKLYSMSGIGFAFPLGETSDYFKPKFSTSLGLNLGLGDGGLFLYPKVSLHAFTFNQITPDAGYTYTLQKGRATTYLLNVALGYRKIVNKWAFYGFAGAGGGFILTPQASVNTSNLQVTQDNKSNGLGIAEGGAGIEYNIGGANLFVEGSYMYGFSKIQNKTFNTAPISIGIKPNLSKLLNKLK
ncbi:autotransporter outer membrane beta-barrel domain-containing protein [Pedobacter sp. KLB.chiD]|uniref:autotransporter outer membrane beta-barrel domain-containing protein n=1 Tax=Pedobacter sp. KLB.chiD TaxID=3387402 RepID=UPI003999810E